MEHRTIFLIEDNPDEVALVKRALQKFNISNKIDVARDGAEALEYLFRTGRYENREATNPAVVLLDIRLPKVDGLEVLRKLREDSRTKFLPVVILTSSDEEADVLRSYNLGANSYVRKPIKFDKFSEAVGQLGLYWLLLNESPPSTAEA